MAHPNTSPSEGCDVGKSLEDPNHLYPDGFRRTFRDAMEKCSAKEREHYMACQRVILNFDLGVIHQYLYDVQFSFSRNYSLGQIQQARADLETIDRLMAIQLQHTAHIAHLDKLEGHQTTPDIPEKSKRQNHLMPLPQMLPLPAHLGDMSTVTITQREERALRSRQHSGNGLESKAAIHPSHLPGPQQGIVQPWRHPTDISQPSYDQQECANPLVPIFTADPSTCGDWESSSNDDAPVPTNANTTRVVAPANKSGWLIDLDDRPVSPTTPETSSHREDIVVDWPSSMARLVGTSGAADCTSACDKAALLHQPDHPSSAKSRNAQSSRKQLPEVEDTGHTSGGHQTAAQTPVAPSGPVLPRECAMDAAKPYRRSQGQGPHHIDLPDDDLVDRLFNSEAERQAAMKMNRGPGGRVPQMFRYGVQYAPRIPPPELELSPQILQGDYECRSVMLSSVPNGAGLRDILPRVRGGKIVHATLVDTTSHGMGLTAVVTFADWNDASAYAHFSRVTPDRISVLGRQVVVKIADTPTYPSHWIQVAQDKTVSRCLEFRLFPKESCHELLDYLESRLVGVQETLEDVWVGQHDTLVLLFRSIEHAMRIYGIISSSSQYENRRSDLGYGDDPCAESLANLKQPACLARGDHPSLLDERVSRKATNQIEPTIMPSPCQAQSVPRSTRDLPPISHIAQQAIIDTLTTPSAVVEGQAASPGQLRVAPNGQVYDMKIFRPEGEPWVGYKFYSLGQFHDKYGYAEYKKEPGEWRKEWPYVGQLKRFKETSDRQASENKTLGNKIPSKETPGNEAPDDDKWAPKASLPRDDGPFQELIDRDAHSHVRLSEVLAVATGTEAAAVPMSEFKKRYRGAYQEGRREEAHRRFEDFPDDEYPPDGLKWDDLPELPQDVRWPSPEDRPDWKDRFYQVLQRHKDKSDTS